ncbi:hypothetical protein NUW54_g14228 [Trametes sanguinea]|uniref:Uncharacterized protein n=1 Tax=Trametes sanguinea TaxID=158606 RepID=A0ACC1MEB0_9APHY|nr:hypothetical protein NUW54_g14228 [Trametes sanguinea]
MLAWPHPDICIPTTRPGGDMNSSKRKPCYTRARPKPLWGEVLPHYYGVFTCDAYATPAKARRASWCGLRPAQRSAAYSPASVLPGGWQRAMVRSNAPDVAAVILRDSGCARRPQRCTVLK